MNYYALVDANNFYASCERAFNPKLWNIPVVVLSNNDGCIIARSNEAKALGIGMGAPFWEVKSIIKKHGIKVYSSNYQLYGDMSARMMDILQQNCLDVEVYSIDEAFLKLFPFKDDPEILLRDNIKLKADIFQSTGLPVSIGIAPTKTLSKLANHIAKRYTKEGVYKLEPGAAILKKIAVDKVWGVARGYKKRLSKIGVETVADLTRVHTGWMRKEFGVVGVRLLQELQGIPTLDLEPPITARKNIMVSRSFRKDVYNLDEIIEAISTYGTRLCEKLRKYDQATGQITIFLIANPFRKVTSGRQYFSRTIELPEASSNTNEIITWSVAVAKSLFKKGVNYKKAGILAARLRPNENIQTNLFMADRDREKLKKLMTAIDGINKKMGRNNVHFASCGQKKKQTWSRKEQWASPRYTTRWEEILKVD